jgi:hypothetical protein
MHMTRYDDIGTMPAVFGQAMAAFVLCELAGQVGVRVSIVCYVSNVWWLAGQGSSLPAAA